MAIGVNSDHPPPASIAYGNDVRGLSFQVGQISNERCVTTAEKSARQVPGTGAAKPMDRHVPSVADDNGAIRSTERRQSNCTPHAEGRYSLIRELQLECRLELLHIVSGDPRPASIDAGKHIFTQLRDYGWRNLTPAACQ